MAEKRASGQEDIDLLDYLIILLKHKGLIIRITSGFAATAAVISLILPPVYEARARILPSRQNSFVPAQLPGDTGLAGAAGVLNNTSGSSGDLYVGLLKSRTVMDRIIERFGLLKLYRVKRYADARKKLEKALDIDNDAKSGIITIGVEDRDPGRSADMANAFVEELQNLNNGLAVAQGAQSRLFYRKQLDDAKASFEKAEDSMKAFQEKTGLMQPEIQGAAIIQSIAALRAQIAAQEVEIRVMKTYSTASNPLLQEAQDALGELRAQEARLEAKGGNPDAGPIMPSGNIPALQAGYSNRLMDLAFAGKFYELIQKQYDSAGVNEAGDPSFIQVVDRALPPEKRIKPKTALIVTIAAFTGFLFSILVSFLIEYRMKIINNPENSDKLKAIRKYCTLRSAKKQDRDPM